MKESHTYRTLYTSNLGRVTDFSDAFPPNEEVKMVELSVPRNLSAIKVIDGYCAIKVFDEGEPLKSCLMCRHHSFSHVAIGKWYKEISCGKHDCKTLHTQAVVCEELDPFESFEELRKHREAIATSFGASDLSKEMVPPREGFFKLDLLS